MKPLQLKVVPSLSLNHSSYNRSCRGLCTNAEVGRMGRRHRNSRWGRHAGIFRAGFSHNAVLSMGIQELARGQMPKCFICLGNHLGNYSEWCSEIQFRSFMAPWQASVSKTGVLALWMSHMTSRRSLWGLAFNGQSLARRIVAVRNR